MFAVTINYGFFNREKDNKTKLQFRLSQNLNYLFPVTRMLAYPRFFLYSSLQLADDFSFCLLSYLERPPITFSVMLILRNRLYVSDYADLTKPKTRGIIAELTDIFTTFFLGKFNQVVNDFIDIKFRGFSSGSLVTNFDLTFEPTSTVSSSNIIQALQEGNATRDLQFEVLENITVARMEDTDDAATTATTPTGLHVFVVKKTFLGL